MHNAAKPGSALAGRNDEVGELTAELRALNNCSALLHARWREKLRERVAAQPAHFAARLAAMRKERAGRRDCVGKPKAAKTVRPSARAATHPLQGLLWRWAFSTFIS